MSIGTGQLSAQAAFLAAPSNGLLWFASPDPSLRNRAHLALLETPFDLRIPCRFPAVLNLTPEQLERAVRPPTNPRRSSLSSPFHANEYRMAVSANSELASSVVPEFR